MGMFDYVNFQMDCPQCGKRLFGFQTKDTDCELETVEPDETQYFYIGCPQCKAWVEFSRARPRLPARDTPLTLEQLEAVGFEMKVTPNAELRGRPLADGPA